MLFSKRVTVVFSSLSSTASSCRSQFDILFNPISRMDLMGDGNSLTRSINNFEILLQVGRESCQDSGLSDMAYNEVKI